MAEIKASDQAKIKFILADNQNEYNTADKEKRNKNLEKGRTNQKRENDNGYKH